MSISGQHRTHVHDCQKQNTAFSQKSEENTQRERQQGVSRILLYMSGYLIESNIGVMTKKNRFSSNPQRLLCYHREHLWRFSFFEIPTRSRVMTPQSFGLRITFHQNGYFQLRRIMPRIQLTHGSILDFLGSIGSQESGLNVDCRNCNICQSYPEIFANKYEKNYFWILVFLRLKKFSISKYHSPIGNFNKS